MTNTIDETQVYVCEHKCDDWKQQVTTLSEKVALLEQKYADEKLQLEQEREDRKLKRHELIMEHDELIRKAEARHTSLVSTYESDKAQHAIEMTAAIEKSVKQNEPLTKDGVDTDLRVTTLEDKVAPLSPRAKVFTKLSNSRVRIDLVTMEKSMVPPNEEKTAWDTSTSSLQQKIARDESEQALRCEEAERTVFGMRAGRSDASQSVVIPDTRKNGPRHQGRNNKWRSSLKDRGHGQDGTFPFGGRSQNQNQNQKDQGQRINGFGPSASKMSSVNTRKSFTLSTGLVVGPPLKG